MRSRRTAVVVLVAALVLLISALPGRATFSKQYTLTITPTPPTSVAAGGEHPFAATYKGKSSFGIGSSNLSVPSVFTGVSLVSFVANKGTATVVGNIVQLRGMSLGNNKIATVTLKATVPCTPGTYPWSAITKSSTSFAGGADFTMISPSSLNTSVSGSCAPDSLRFVAGSAPTDAIAGDRISDTAFDPSGGDVLVEAIRNGSRLTSFTGQISLAVSG